MLNSKLVILCIFALFTLSCSKGEINICENRQDRCQKVGKLLSIIGVQSRLENQGSESSIYINKADKPLYDKLEQYLNPYLQKEKIISDKITNLLVPVLKSNEEQGITKLELQPGVLSVECFDVNNSIIKTVNKSCNIYYISKLISKDDLISIARDYFQNDDHVFEYKDLIQEVENLNFDESSSIKSDSKLIELEPFSFHVPYVEKDIAGMQLILVLIVFLFAGLILGYWSGSKGRKV